MEHIIYPIVAGAIFILLGMLFLVWPFNYAKTNGKVTYKVALLFMFLGAICIGITLIGTSVDISFHLPIL